MGAACCAGSALAGGAAASAGPSSLLDGTIWGLVSALPVTLYHFYPTVTLVLTTLAALGAATLYCVLIMLTPTTKSSRAGELTFLTAKSDSPAPLPSLIDEDSDDRVQLSIVIPAYNEVDRLPGMLAETVTFLETLRKEKRALASRPQAKGSISSPLGEQETVQAALQDPLTTYEIVIVDDGSKDSTHSVALDFAKENALPSGAEIRVVRLEVNRGKGGAVRHGVLHTRGTLILFADADGATKFSDVGKLAASMSRIVTTEGSRPGHGIVVGSRAHMVKSDAVVKRSFLRNFLMHGFHLFLSLLMRPPTLSALLPARLRSIAKNSSQLPTQPEIKDTQCGFKLLTRPTARLIFPNLHIDGWIFDVEILMLAQMSSKLALESQPDLADQSCPAQTSKAAAASDDEEYWRNLRRLPLPIAECAVDWKEVSGSKIDLLRDSIRMALDLLVIRFNYGTRRWASPPPAL